MIPRYARQPPSFQTTLLADSWQQFLQLWQLAIFWWGLALCSYASFLPGAEAAGQGGREATAGRDPVGMTTEVVLATARAVDVRAQVPGVTKTLQRHQKTIKRPCHKIHKTINMTNMTIPQRSDYPKYLTSRVARRLPCLGPKVALPSRF